MSAVVYKLFPSCRYKLQSAVDPELLALSTPCLLLTFASSSAMDIPCRLFRLHINQYCHELNNNSVLLSTVCATYYSNLRSLLQGRTKSGSHSPFLDTAHAVLPSPGFRCRRSYSILGNQRARRQLNFDNPRFTQCRRAQCYHLRESGGVSNFSTPISLFLLRLVACTSNPNPLTFSGERVKERGGERARNSERQSDD